MSNTETVTQTLPFEINCQVEGEKPFGKLIVKNGVIGGGSWKVASGLKFEFKDSLGRRVFLGALGGNLRFIANSYNGQHTEAVKKINEEAEKAERISQALALQPQAQEFLSSYTIDRAGRLPVLSTKAVPFAMSFVDFVDFLRTVGDNELTREEKRIAFLYTLRQGVKGMQALHGLQVEKDGR